MRNLRKDLEILAWSSGVIGTEISPFGLMWGVLGTGEWEHVWQAIRYAKWLVRGLDAWDGQEYTNW